MAITDPQGRKGHRQGVTIELGIVPRARHLAHIHHFLHASGPEHVDEFLQGTRAVTDGPDSRRRPFSRNGANIAHHGQILCDIGFPRLP